MNIDARQARRSIRHLKRGIFPPESIELFTVGRTKAKTIVQEHLDRVRSMHESEHLFVEGDYGTGKSHFLKLVESLALRNGFATTWITLDGYEHAFNHPTRYLSRLLESIRIPNNDIFGLYSLCKYWLSNKKRTTLLDWASQSNAWRFKNPINRLSKPDGDWRYCQQNLNCSDLRYKSGKQYHEEFYYILYSLASLMHALGFKGIVFLFDELESVMTLISNARSQLLSFEVLNNLTGSRILPHSYFVFSVTPDFGRFLLNKQQYYEQYYNYSYKKGLSFVNRWVKQGLNTLALNRLDKQSRNNLFNNLLLAHSVGYSWSPFFKFSPKTIEIFCDKVEKWGFNERESIRTFVHLLELSHQYKEFDPAKAISEA
jgi:hypothetical protein